MFTLSAIGTWFASYGIGIVLKFAASALSDFVAQRQADANAKEVGRVTAERDQEAAAREATERELAASQAAPQTVDDAISRLEDGSA